MLVCLDRSPFSEVCVPYAVSFARTFGSDVTLLHVMQPAREHGNGHPTAALSWEITKQEVQTYLEKMERQVSAAIGRRSDVRIEQGNSAERIIAVARELHVDLTVLASHGEGGVTAWSLGSTVQRLLLAARGSLFIAHASHVPPTVSPKRILVPLDGSLRTESVLSVAARIASAFDAEVLLAHVVQEPLQTAVHTPEDLKLSHDLAVRLEAGSHTYLEGLRHRLPREVASRALVARHANEREGLLTISKNERIDLVVLSAHGAACDPTRSFGSMTAHLLTHSTVPLLVLQDLAESEQHLSPDVEEERAPPLRASYPPETV
jgi:nucleotide-binding universal stress UspA family protein